MATFTNEYAVSEILDELSIEEKHEMLDALAEDLEKEDVAEQVALKTKRSVRAVFVEYFRDMSDYDKRKFLADALYVPNYYDNEALKSALEPIITAR